MHMLTLFHKPGLFAMQKKSYQKYSNAKYVGYSKHYCVYEFILTDEYLWYLSKLIHDKNNNKNQTYKQTTKYK